MRARAGRVELTRILGADPSSRRPPARASSTPHPRISSLPGPDSRPHNLAAVMVPLPGKRHRAPTDLEDEEDYDFENEGPSNRRDSVSVRHG